MGSVFLFEEKLFFQTVEYLSFRKLFLLNPLHPWPKLLCKGTVDVIYRVTCPIENVILKTFVWSRINEQSKFFLFN